VRNNTILLKKITRERDALASALERIANTLELVLMDRRARRLMGKGLQAVVDEAREALKQAKQA
jgi:hypothetical protein